MYSVGLALAASLAFLQPLQAHAEPYTAAFDNGGIGYDWRYCVSGPNQCGISNGERLWKGVPGSGGTILYAGSDVADITSDHGFNMATLVGPDITLARAPTGWA